MRSINEVTIFGNVGKVIGFEKSAKLNIATNPSYKGEDGTYTQVTDWVSVTILSEKQAAWVAENVEKGNRVLVKARIANNQYQKNGETVFTTDIIVTDFTNLDFQAEAE